MAKPENSAETRQICTQGNQRQVGKFALKSRDDVEAQIVAKYGLEKQQVQRDVDSLMKGRHI